MIHPGQTPRFSELGHGTPDARRILPDRLSVRSALAPGKANLPFS
jgi:hypothetical protein